MLGNRIRFAALLFVLISIAVLALPQSRSAIAFAQALASEPVLTRPVSILFMGTDMVYPVPTYKKLRDVSSFRGNSDAMMVVRFDPRNQTIKVLQIPRDTLVKFRGGPPEKINGANRLGGPPAAMQAVHSVCGIRPDYYALMNLQGLVNIVDSLGGVTVRVPQSMRYADHTARWAVDLQPGVKTLNGLEAMGFVRFRHDDKGDIGRIARQRIFMRAVAEKIRSTYRLEPAVEITEAARRNIETNIPAVEMVRMATFARAVPGSRITMSLLPVIKTKTGEFLASTH